MLPRAAVALLVAALFVCCVAVDASEEPRVESRASDDSDEDDDLDLLDVDDRDDDDSDLDLLDVEDSDEEDEDDSEEARSAGKEVEVGRKKVKIKIKKKHKKFLKQLAMIHFMVKAALLPLVVGALKLLTGKALLVTMMALVLVLSVTFSHSPPKNTTEIINLVPNKHHDKRSLPDEYTMSIAIEKAIYGSKTSRR